MNRTKIQYAIIAYQEMCQAKQQVDFWQEHLTKRLANLDQLEMEEFARKSGLPTRRSEADSS